MASLQRNVAGQNVTFALVNSSTGGALLGATVTVYVTKDNGAQATGVGTVTETGHGQYNYAPAQAETSAVDVGLLFTASGAIPVNYDFHTDSVDANGLLKVDIEDINGNATSGVNLGKATGNIGRGTCAGGGTTTSIPTSSFSPNSGVQTGQFIGRTIIFDGNTSTLALQGQATSIQASTIGPTPTFTVVALTTPPLSGDTFSVI